jgi:two-component system, cell cycle sensor histidine kinase and response regulator CckA
VAKSIRGKKHTAKLRRLAEQSLIDRTKDGEKPEVGDTTHLNQELKVHQIELEMQNEELRRSQQELEVARDKYLRLFDFAPVGYLTLDEKGRILEANITIAKMLGVVRGRLYGQMFNKFIARTHKDHFLQYQRDLFGSKLLQQCELHCKRNDLSSFPVQIESVVIEEEAGVPYLLWKMTVSDITQLKEQENLLKQSKKAEEIAIQAKEVMSENLQQSDACFRSLAEFATQGIIFIDMQGLITFWNPWATQIFQFSAQEALGKPASIIISQRYQEQHLAAFNRALRNGKLQSNPGDVFSVIGKRRDGSEVPLEMTLSSWKVGDTLNFSAIIRDVTYQKNIEDQLRQSQKLEAIGTLAGGVAHDFNNLLGIIMGNVELASLGISDSKEVMPAIQTAAERGRDLVSQLLTFSRKTMAKKQLLKPVLLIREVLKFLRSTIPSSIEINENLQAKNVHVYVDPSQFHQIIMNLCTNAHQAMGEEGGNLTVGLKSILINKDKAVELSINAGSYIEITISDTGPGMTKEVQEHIFEPFFTTKLQGKGTGLGLAVVHGAIQKCGGGIEVISALGKGTTFKVYIPVSDVKATAESQDGKNRSLAKGMGKIMFVDDESGLVNVGVRLLEALGYEAIGFTDPKKALEEFLQLPDSFDAVITDQIMPGMVGNELAARILEVRPSTPIFLCTGFSESVTEENAAKIGFQKFFLKPLSISNLAVALNDALALPSAAGKRGVRQV